MGSSVSIALMFFLSSLVKTCFLSSSIASIASVEWFAPKAEAPHYNSLAIISRFPAALNAAVAQPLMQPLLSVRHTASFTRYTVIRKSLTVQTLVQQYQHPLSSCGAQSQLQQQPVPCSKHSTASTVRCSAAGAASTGVEAAVQQQQQQQQQQQPSSNGSVHQVIDMDEVEDSNGASSSSSRRLDVVIKVLSSADELQAVARLRAEAYYAEDRSRFAESFKRQFAAQEVESLRQRTSASSGRPQLSACLVALQPGTYKVLGCIDIRLPQTATGMRVLGVPEDDAAGCYLLNVVVDEDWRSQGIGKALMTAAMAQAVHTWGAQRLYTHVEADNEVASGLYKSCGFQEHSSEEKYANTLSLGRLVLLMASAEDAPAVHDTLLRQEE